MGIMTRVTFLDGEEYSCLHSFLRSSIFAILAPYFFIRSGRISAMDVQALVFCFDRNITASATSVTVSFRAALEGDCESLDMLAISRVSVDAGAKTEIFILSLRTSPATASEKTFKAALDDE